MSTKYKFHDPDACYFVTFALVDWVDLFTRNVYKEILLESWRYCQQQKGLLIHAPFFAESPVSGTLREMKYK